MGEIHVGEWTVEIDGWTWVCDDDCQGDDHEEERSAAAREPASRWPARPPGVKPRPPT